MFMLSVLSQNWFKRLSFVVGVAQNGKLIFKLKTAKAVFRLIYRIVTLNEPLTLNIFDRHTSFTNR